MTTVTTVPLLTTAPNRSQGDTGYSATADAWAASLGTFNVGMNVSIGEINVVAGEVVANLALTNADVVSTNADVVSTNADAVQTSLDLVETNQDTIDTAADLVLTNADVVAAAASAASAAAVAGAFVGTSTTSLLIELGTKVFTTQATEQYTAGIFMTAVSDASGSNFMFGQVISYSGTTLTLDVQVTGGSGTLADWNLSLTGARGAAGPTGPAGDPGISTFMKYGAV